MASGTRIHRLRRRLVVLVSIGGACVLAGGGGLAALENHVVSSYGEGVWWALSLMTTVGFVGEKPETAGGRVLSALLMVAGFAMMALTTAAIASLLVREEEEPDREAEREFEHSTHDVLAAIEARLAAIESTITNDVSSARPPADGVRPPAGPDSS